VPCSLHLLLLKGESKTKRYNVNRFKQRGKSWTHQEILVAFKIQIGKDRLSYRREVDNWSCPFTLEPLRGSPILELYHMKDSLPNKATDSSHEGNKPSPLWGKPPKKRTLGHSLGQIGGNRYQFPKGLFTRVSYKSATAFRKPFKDFNRFFCNTQGGSPLQI